MGVAECLGDTVQPMQRLTSILACLQVSLDCMIMPHNKPLVDDCAFVPTMAFSWQLNASVYVML